MDNKYLSEEERDFLKVVLESLKNERNVRLMKVDFSNGEKSCLRIDWDADDGSGMLVFPHYPAGKYYKGMKSYKRYSPEELDLW